MSTLEILQMRPSQWKVLLSTLGIVDPFDDYMIIFDIDKVEHPQLP